ncbi:methyltransferase domain-containing protein [Thalassoroseus pseudoceratinae]|uniref:methyltransferase domain-containing protein n=1 Tax=Thalassoroseus pseudoceratinae TaxID=2713176 RepID=UPI001F0DF4A9|nr:methyltransferase domain-containing protein [Thalassoroseus pseudoceratinae]
MTTLPQSSKPNEEQSVYTRYAAAAGQREEDLCCPVDYNPLLLEVIPEEVIERDYGCGDPSAFVRSGDTVLDLGAGGGKICFMASQLAGADGRVIGVDLNPKMLALARKHQSTVADRIGYANVEFRRGMIQDLALDLDQLEVELAKYPVKDASAWLELRQIEQRLRETSPMIADESVDCVLSNCVLNLVRPQDRVQLFQEVFRVLKRGGRAAISDIVSDETVPAHLRANPELWSGCISGAFREDEFLNAFEDAGFHGMHIAKRQSEPWRTVEGIEFRSITVLAYKGKDGPCLERKQAAVYRGPFKKVEDDDGHVYRRGQRMAVCDKLIRLLRQEPYAGSFEIIEPRIEVPLESAQPFDCRRGQIRSPRETKGENFQITTDAGDCCDPGGDCC